MLVESIAFFVSGLILFVRNDMANRQRRLEDERQERQEDDLFAEEERRNYENMNFPPEENLPIRSKVCQKQD